MSTRSRHPFDRDTAEQLLCGEPVSTPTGGPAGTDAIARVLAAAAAPARSHELSGQNDAVAAFRAARLRPGARPRRRPVIMTSAAGSSFARALALKFAAAAAAVIVAGGVALAASTGHLSIYLRHFTGTAHTSHAVTPTPSHHPHPTAAPSASFIGLCHAYTAGVAANPGKALQNPAFTGLIEAAGGKGNVSAFCAAVLRAAPGHSATPHHTPSGHAKSTPSGHAKSTPPGHAKGTPHSTGRPSSPPTPTNRPSH